MSLYPLKFKTIYKEKIWGGQKIKTMLNKDFGDLSNCGETWELSGVEGNISEVKEGNLKGKHIKELIETYKGDLIGHKVYAQFGTAFPLLIKFIDANEDLSVQVHPDDQMALERHNSFGKTEMWYVLQADPGAKLISGFRVPMTKEVYLESFRKGQLMDILNEIDVNADDVYFLPAGRVHTIGKGLLIAEIQQTSDITYRIYDFDREDSNGNKRELHVEQAVDAIDYTFHEDYRTHYETKKDEITGIVSCQYFTTNKLDFSKSITRDLPDLDSFKIYMCLEGAFVISAEDINISVDKGEVVLVPAKLKKYKLIAKAPFKALETYIVR